MNYFPPEIKQWLNGRTISDEVIEQANLSWKDNQLVIPIYDQSGKFLFNKYRKHPLEESDAPKYRYDKGGTSQLYNLHLFHSDFSKIIICEGELDVLALLSHNILAVSSTGGSGTFLKEWAQYFKNKEVYICYDNDDAGIKGAFNVQSLIPHAKIIWLEKEKGVKDITDWFSKLNNDFLSLEATAKRYVVPRKLETLPETKMELNAIIKLQSSYANEVLMEQRELREKRLSFRHTEILLDYLIKVLEDNKRTQKFWRSRQNQDPWNLKRTVADELQTAKQVPISKFINFDRGKFARCIWHSENTPSMHYYRIKNKVKCFGCGKCGDVIDVVMQLEKVDIKEAIRKILK